LVFPGVVQGYATAVNGLDDVATVSVPGLDPSTQVSVNPLIDRYKKILAESSPSPAVSSRVLPGDGQIKIITPCLDEAHGLRKRGVGFENLGEPGPEDDHIAIVADSLRNREAVEKVGRQYVGKLHGVC
jgi:hypothetical protein